MKDRSVQDLATYALPVHEMKQYPNIEFRRLDPQYPVAVLQIEIDPATRKMSQQQGFQAVGLSLILILNTRLEYLYHVGG